MSRFSQFIEEYGLDLRDFYIDEDGWLVLTPSGECKVEGVCVAEEGDES